MAEDATTQRTGSEGSSNAPKRVSYMQELRQAKMNSSRRGMNVMDLDFHPKHKSRRFLPTLEEKPVAQPDYGYDVSNSESGDNDVEQHHLGRRKTGYDLHQELQNIEDRDHTNRRSALKADDAAWRSFLAKVDELDDADQTGAGDAAAHNSTLPLYSVPIQRQRWGQDQFLPHVNWGDLYFDLFYVALAYNLGHLIVESLNQDLWTRGLLYFVGIFGPLFKAWEEQVFYQARFSTLDLTHRLIEIARTFCVGFTVMHVKGLEKLTAYSSEPDGTNMTRLCVGLFLESLISLGLNVELYFCGSGDRKAIQNHAKRKIFGQFIPTSLVYLAAAILSVFARPLGDDYDKEANNSSSGYEDYAGDADHRDLAETSDAADYDYGWQLFDVPLMLTLGAYLLNIVLKFIRKVWMKKQKDHDVRDHLVPSNIDFLIHRYGEWVMLMIGESVLSLLIVDTAKSQDYYIVACLGILAVTFLQLLKSESEPSHSDEHALWQSLTKGMLYSDVIQIFSMALIAFGVSYKVMLTLEEQEAVDYEGEHRSLAGGEIQVTNFAVASLFSGAFTIVLLSLEAMTALHRARGDTYKMFVRNYASDKWSIKWSLVIITLMKAALICFCATLSQWLTEPSKIAVTCLLVILSFIGFRIFEWGVIHKMEEIKKVVSVVARHIPGEVKSRISRSKVQVGAAARRLTRSIIREKESSDSQSSDPIDLDDAEVKKIMLERLGGEKRLNEAVDRFFDVLVHHPRFINLFAGVDVRILKWHQYNLLSIAFATTPEDFDVHRLILTRHKRLFAEGLMDGNTFDVVLQIMTKTLADMDVDQDLIEAVASNVAPLRDHFEEGARLARILVQAGSDSEVDV